MTVSQVEVDALVSYCRSNLGEKDLWITPDGYPNSLALCIIDSIYSTGSHYTSVVNVINRYRAARGQREGAAALLESISAAGGPRAWANSVADNLKPAHTKPGAPLKAEVIEQAAALMLEHGIDNGRGLGPGGQAQPSEEPGPRRLEEAAQPTFWGLSTAGWKSPVLARWKSPPSAGLIRGGVAHLLGVDGLGACGRTGRW